LLCWTVALLDRIQYMKANHMNLGICEEASMREDLDVKVIKTKSPWIPSFVWEDFGVSAVKNTMCKDCWKCINRTSENM